MLMGSPDRSRSEPNPRFGTVPGSFLSCDKNTLTKQLRKEGCIQLTGFSLSRRDVRAGAQTRT